MCFGICPRPECSLWFCALTQSYSGNFFLLCKRTLMCIKICIHVIAFRSTAEGIHILALLDDLMADLNFSDLLCLFLLLYLHVRNYWEHQSSHWLRLCCCIALVASLLLSKLFTYLISLAGKHIDSPCEKVFSCVWCDQTADERERHYRRLA